jgi:transposase
MGRPSIDPELMIRMLIIGYIFAIRSERAICRDLQVNLAYRWFCGLSIEDKIPDHSVFSRARHERFRESDMFRRLFERVVEACIAAGLVGGEGFQNFNSGVPQDGPMGGLPSAITTIVSHFSRPRHPSRILTLTMIPL